MATQATVLSPYPAGSLPEEHQAQIVKIRQQLVAWRDAARSATPRRRPAGTAETAISAEAQETLSTETQRLAGMAHSAHGPHSRSMFRSLHLALEVAAPYAFTPEPPYKFRRVLLSCIRCYWLALVGTCSDEERSELAARLNCVTIYLCNSVLAQALLDFLRSHPMATAYPDSTGRSA